MCFTNFDFTSSNESVCVQVCLANLEESFTNVEIFSYEQVQCANMKHTYGGLWHT
jgi:hypothetical protein